MSQLSITGAKGGGGQRAPVQAPDSLRSIAYFRILDLVSEGEIGGLVNGLQSVYLNDTPLANADGSLNFQNAHVESRTGTQDQDYIPGYGAVENEISIGVELKSAAPWVRAISNTQLSAVRITLGVPQLQSTDTGNGDINGYTVAYHIDVQTDGGAWQTALTSAFTGKTTTKYQRSHRIDLPTATTGWNVRVVRTTANANSATIADATTVDSYTEIIDAKLRYPNSALVAVSGDAATFSNIPSRAYDLWGRLIRVPSNYDPLTRTYAGVWDGSFKIAWTNNPAWVFLDLVTHPRYGLGNMVTDAQIDKWALYAIAQYCDQSVPDGNGGTEPRFTCNVFLQTAGDAYKLLGDLASLFRGIAWWSGSAIRVSADLPADPTYLYTAANVIDGKFTYASSARKTRYTTALVAWNNPANNYVADAEYVQHDAGLRRYGIQPLQVTAFGCTSRGQAQRTGQWALMTAQAETETVTFSVGLDGMLAAPGQIIRVQDPARAGKRQGGRIHAATATAITVDKIPDAVAVGDKLTCTLPSGTTETHAITAIAGTTLSVAAPGFSAAPQAESSWLTESTTLVAQQFRVVNVVEDKSSDKISFTLTAVQNVAAKYDAIDTSAALQSPPISVLPATTQAPVASVSLSGGQVTVQGTSQTVVTIAWPPAEGADTYRVGWRRNDGEWIDAGGTPGCNMLVYGAYTGTYVASVRAISAGGVTSIPTESAPTAIAGKAVAPPPPTLTAAGGQLQIVLNWTWPAGVNVEDTSYTEVWVSPTSTMADGESVGAVAYPGTNYTISGLLPQQQRWAWVRLVDKSGNVGSWSLPANAVGGTAADLFQPLQDQTDALRDDVDATLAQVQVLQGQVGDILQADAWVSTKTYPAGDLVQHGGQLFRSLIDGNLNHQPVASTTNANWGYIGNYASLGEAVGANAANVATLQNTVTQQGNTITANSQAITQNAAAITDKADASALDATNVTVTQQGDDITAVVQDVSLLGAHNAGKTAFNLNSATVKIDGGQTLAQTLTGLQAADNELDSRVDSEQQARIDGDTANANAILAVQAKTNVNPNLLINPTGAAGTANWQTISGGTLSSGDFGEGYRFQFAAAVNAGRVTSIPQKALANRSYTVSADIVGLAGFTMAVYFYDASDMYLGSTPPVAVPTGAAWTRVASTGASPANTTQMLVNFIRTSGVAGNLFFRNVKLEQSTVPTVYGDEASTGSNAQVVQSLTANVGPGGAYAQATTMLDVNGRITGVRQTNDGTTGDFVIVADKFGIVSPSGGARTEYSSGNWRVYDAAGTLRVRMGIW